MARVKEIKIQIPVDYIFVPGVRICIARIASHFGFNDRETYQIETVVDEVCNNAIEHGKPGEDKKVILNCKFQKGRMELMVKNAIGRKFDIREVFERNVRLFQEEISSGKIDPFRRGRGFIIVQKLVDKLDIKTTPHDTTVIILKKASKPQKAPKPGEGNGNRNRDK